MFIQAIQFNENTPELIGVNVGAPGTILKAGNGEVEINGVTWPTTLLVTPGNDKGTILVGALSEYLRLLGTAKNIMYENILKTMPNKDR